MSSHRERVVRGSVVSEHLVHVFDETRSLVHTVATYLDEGWKRRDTLLVVARHHNWALTAVELEGRACPVEQLLASGRLITLDAPAVLETFAVDGEPEHEKFRQEIGILVRRLCAQSLNGVAVYDEMADLLATSSNFIGAERLEALWLELSAQCSFRLLCGYSASPDRRTHVEPIDGVRDVDAADASVRASKLLESWLLADRRSNYHMNP